MPRQKSLLRMILEPIAFAIALAMLVRTALQVYSVPSRSMAPTLEAGDTILVTPYVRSSPERGHVIVFESPADRKELMVKRVVAVPGDFVDSRVGRLRIGGYTLAEPYVRSAAATGSIEALIIPSETYFVLGDNRADSVDSRSWGVVPRSLVVGRARMVLWSSAPRIGDVAHASNAHEPARAPRRHRAERLFKWVE